MNKQGLRACILCTVQNLHKTFQSSLWTHSPTSADLRRQESYSPIIHNYWNKSRYKWTCPVQTLAVQGSILCEHTNTELWKMRVLQSAFRKLKTQDTWWYSSCLSLKAWKPEEPMIWIQSLKGREDVCCLSSEQRKNIPLFDFYRPPMELRPK